MLNGTLQPLALCSLILAVLVAGPVPVRARPGFVRESGEAGLIERVYLRRGAQHDPGAIVALLHNRGQQPIQLNAIEVNGHSLGRWPKATNPVAWHRLTPSGAAEGLKPGQTALLTAKLVRSLSGVIRLSVHDKSGSESVLLTADAVEPVRVAAIRYGPNGKLINLFVRNTALPGGNSGTGQQLDSVMLDGKQVWSGDQGGRRLPAGSVTRIGLKLDEALKPGRRLLFTLNLGDRRIAVSDRVSPCVLPGVDGFRLSIESGHQGMARRIDADPLVLQAFKFKKESTGAPGSYPSTGASKGQASGGGDSGGEGLATESLAQRQGEHWSLVKVSHGRFVSKVHSDLACVFACPTHSTDSYQTSAYLGMEAQRQLEDGSPHQSFIHACRTQPLSGIAVFGAIADAVRFNGQLQTAVTEPAPHRDYVPWTVYTLTRYAARSASPSVALPMIPLERDKSLFKGRAPLATEARQMVYAALSAGAGGVAYRVMPQDWRDEQRDRMLDEVKTVNQEIRQVRGLLALGYPRGLVSSDQTAIQATCIDARPLGLLVLLINHDIHRSPPEMPPSVTAQPHEGVTLSLDLPAGFKPGAVTSIEGADSQPLSDLQDPGSGSGGRASLTLDVPGATRMLLIRPKGGAS